MTLYDKLGASAAKLLAKFGQDITLRKPASGSSYDTATGTVTTGGPAVDTVRKGAVFDFKDGVMAASGGLIQNGDKRLLLDSSLPVPKAEDIVILAGVLWSVKGVKEVNPAGTPVIYELHLRR